MADDDDSSYALKQRRRLVRQPEPERVLEPEPDSFRNLLGGFVIICIVFCLLAHQRAQQNLIASLREEVVRLEGLCATQQDEIRRLQGRLPVTLRPFWDIDW